MSAIFTKEFKEVKTTEKIKTENQKKKKRKKTKIKLIILFFLLFFASAAVALWYFWDEPLLSPLSSLTTFQFLEGVYQPKAKEKKVVYGFLPYWNLNSVTIQPETTHLSYFSLGVGADGNIVTHNDDGTLMPGYHKLNSDKLAELSNLVNNSNGKVEITLTQFNGEDTLAFIADEEAHHNLINSLDSILLAYPVSGVNIDIEYAGEVDDELREKFANFIKKLNQHLDTKYKNVKLSIDMFASASRGKMIWDTRKIGQEVDYIIVMAYDFHRPSSPQAGPVAPLFGGNNLWEHDINQNLRTFIQKVPREKILLGVPFYGYEWQTDSTEPQANTYPNTGGTASYKRVQKILEQKEELQVEEHWHETALSPYLTYIEDEKIYIVYYENARSLAYKLDYVNQLDLGGIAIWALGYEGDTRALWDVVADKL